MAVIGDDGALSERCTGYTVMSNKSSIYCGYFCSERGSPSRKERTLLATIARGDALMTDLYQLDASIDRLASSGDFDALGALLADDFRYNHSTGLSQDKREWLDGLRPLVGRRERLASAIDVELHGDIAVAMGNLDVVWTDGRHAYDRYVRVYRRAPDGQWLVISQRTVPAHDRAPAA
jgi:ketosteroid isomerase-like protein